MQDRFKYRAWNIKNKIYHYNAETTYDGFGGTPVISKQTFYSLLNDDNYIVEQCTGLRDKNGKLIYEGDIIRVEDNNCLIVWDNDNARYNVNGYGEIAYLNYNEIEVIGNIHENADLLENKDE